MKRLISLLIIISLLSPAFTGCKKDKGDPPVLPPAGSMTIDFSNFQPGKKGADEISIPKGTQNSNWEFAAIAAQLWNAVIVTTLAVPVYSFSKVTEQKPVYLEEKTWQWTATATLLSTTYQARLTGQITESDVIWKMYITKEGTGGYTDFLWFEGTSGLDGTAGQWKLYESQANPVELMTIDWTVTGNKIGSIKYTYTKSGNPLKDSYIEYGLTSNALNAYYTISYYNASYQKFISLNVEWSTAQHNGRVKCEEYFGNTDWYCWDSNFLNVTCP